MHAWPQPPPTGPRVTFIRHSKRLNPKYLWPRTHLSETSFATFATKNCVILSKFLILWSLRSMMLTFVIVSQIIQTWMKVWRSAPRAYSLLFARAMALLLWRVSPETVSDVRLASARGHAPAIAIASSCWPIRGGNQRFHSNLHDNDFYKWLW